MARPLTAQGVSLLASVIFNQKRGLPFAGEVRPSGTATAAAGRSPGARWAWASCRGPSGPAVLTRIGSKLLRAAGNDRANGGRGDGDVRHTEHLGPGRGEPPPAGPEVLHGDWLAGPHLMAGQ